MPRGTVADDSSRRRLGDAGRAVALAFRAAPRAVTTYLIASTAVAALPLASAWLLKAIVDQLTATLPDTPNLTGLAVGAAAAGMLMTCLPELVQYHQAQADRAIALVARHELFTALERFVGLSRFENPVFLDQLRLAHESAQSSRRVVDSVFSLAQGFLLIVGFVVSLIVISPVMAVVVGLASAPALMAELKLSKGRAHLAWELSPRQRRELFYSELLSSVPAAKEIRLFGLGPFFRNRALTERREADTALRKMDRRQLGVQGALSAMSGVIAGVGLLWVVGEVRNGRLTVGDLSLFLAAVGGVQSGLSSLVGSIASAYEGLLMFAYYHSIVASPGDLPLPARPKKVTALRTGIEIRNVWFRYSDDHPWALRDLTLSIPRGRTVALVGSNGGGKSTLVKLLCRFYDPTRGAIYWDGVDLRDCSPVDLRERIAAIFQDYMSYEMTATENIALGDISALGEHRRVKAAARAAGVHDTLGRLPRGYDTLLSRSFDCSADGDDPAAGVLLSGGQWQRVALARCLLREARDLVILDEPSSSLDAAAEFEICNRLSEHREGKTSILISHRLGTTRSADEIVVLEDGQITEQGPHDFLVAQGGRYATLFELQASGYRENGARCAT